MADLMYVYQKLGAAILRMMQSAESLQERLAAACTFELFPASLGNASLQLDLREQLEKIIAEVTKVPETAGEGKINATTQQMSDDEARAIIEKIFMLYDDVREAWAKEMDS